MSNIWSEMDEIAMERQAKKIKDLQEKNEQLKLILLKLKQWAKKPPGIEDRNMLGGYQYAQFHVNRIIDEQVAISKTETTSCEACSEDYVYQEDWRYCPKCGRQL
jgi:hypothetical protein